MKYLILFFSFSLTQITQASCLTKTQAQMLAWNQLNKTYCSHEYIENETDLEQCEFAQEQIKNKIKYVSYSAGWTVLIRQFECAAGASCWEWYSISCGGKIQLHQNGEN